MIAQREIIFRAKRVDNVDWVEGSLLIGFTGINYIITMHDHILGMTEIYEVEESTVRQYINRKDGTGQKVFCGDYDADGNMVDWCDSCMGYQFFQIDVPSKDIICCHNCEGEFMFQDHIDEFTITGNIHDKQ